MAGRPAPRFRPMMGGRVLRVTLPVDVIKRGHGLIMGTPTWYHSVPQYPRVFLVGFCRVSRFGGVPDYKTNVPINKSTFVRDKSC